MSRRGSVSEKSQLLALAEENKWTDLASRLKFKVQTKQVNHANDEGLTCLHLACLEEKLDIVTALLKAGGDPSAADNEGTNCLHIAATLSSAPMLKQLIDAAPKKSGLDVNKPDMQGSTPLHLAVEPADEADAAAAAECVEVLLKAGASTTVKNAAGKTALELATLSAVKAAVEGGKKGSKSSRKSTRGNESAGKDASSDAAAASKENAPPDSASKRGGRAKVGVLPDAEAAAPADAAAAASAASGASAAPAKSRRRRPEGGPRADDAFDGLGAETAEAIEGKMNPGRSRAARRGGSRGVRIAEGEDLAALIQEQGARLEQQLTDILNAAESSSHEQYDLVIELLPSEYADERREARQGRSRRGPSYPSSSRSPSRSRDRDRDADDIESGSSPTTAASVTRTTLLQRVRTPSVGLHSKIVYAGEHCYLLLGAPLARLAREAERIKLPVQLKSGIDERLRREKLPYDENDADADGTTAEVVSREGGFEAYAPYRRRVHKLFQLAAHPYFFSCAQRSILLSSILEAPSSAGGAELNLAQLERSHVVAQVFALHDNAERRVLEERWTTESSLGLAPAPITPLYNYFGADLTLYLAFLRLYSQGLWVPAILGLVLFVFQETECAGGIPHPPSPSSRLFLHPRSPPFPQPTPRYAGRESVWQAIYSLFIVVWSSVFLQQWTRTSAKLTHQWATPTPADVAAQEGGASEVRLQFDSPTVRNGFYLPSDDFVPLDADSIPDGAPSQLKPRFTWGERNLRLVASWAVLGLCAVTSIMVQLGLLLFRSWVVLSLRNPYGGQVLASVLTALVVELMQAAFMPLVEVLLAWQNHRSAHIYECVPRGLDPWTRTPPLAS